MVGAGAIVAQGFAGIGSEKDGPGVFQMGLPRLRRLGGDLQVLGRHAVADLARFEHTSRLNQCAALIDGLQNDLRTRHLGQESLHRHQHLLNVWGIWAEQNALCQGVVLGLGEQIHGHPMGRGAAIGQHQNLARARNHIDAHLTKDLALGACHIGVARACDLVHPRHRGRAIGQGRDGLGATQREHPVHATDMGGGQHQRVLGAMRCGHHHHHFPHPSDLRGDGVHDDT